MEKVNIFWFRRDLRLEDNIGLFKALNDEQKVLPIFIFDRNILDRLPEKDARVLFIHQTLNNLKKSLQAHGFDMQIFYGKPDHVPGGLDR